MTLESGMVTVDSLSCQQQQKKLQEKVKYHVLQRYTSCQHTCLACSLVSSCRNGSLPSNSASGHLYIHQLVGIQTIQDVAPAGTIYTTFIS